MESRDGVDVPPLAWEDHRWTVDPDGPFTRAERVRGSGPYRSAVTPMIAQYTPVLPADLVADIEEAAFALATFDAHAATTLGATSPALGPMSSILLRTESASSSQIEQITAGARQLALAELDEAQSENAVLVVGNVRAMEAALRLATDLDEAAVLAMHRELLARDAALRGHAGRYRRELVWIGTSSASPRGAAHVAPQASLVPDAMRDLVEFLHREDLPVLAQAAIAHAQFETIHPFVDGNGRTGRALIHAVLHNKGALTTTTAPVSAGLLRETEVYFSALDAYRRGDARPILESFGRAARFAARSGVRLVDDLAGVLARSAERMSGLRSDAGAWKVLPRLIGQPVVNSRYLVRELGMDRVGAQRALQQLVGAGVLEERTGRRRGRLWQHQGVLDVLDRYAEGLRRR